MAVRAFLSSVDSSFADSFFSFGAARSVGVGGILPPVSFRASGLFLASAGRSFPLALMVHPLLFHSGPFSLRSLFRSRCPWSRFGRASRFSWPCARPLLHSGYLALSAGPRCLQSLRHASLRVGDSDLPRRRPECGGCLLGEVGRAMRGVLGFGTGPFCLSVSFCRGGCHLGLGRDLGRSIFGLFVVCMPTPQSPPCIEGVCTFPSEVLNGLLCPANGSGFHSSTSPLLLLR
jgi:hypothetical protein